MTLRDHVDLVFPAHKIYQPVRERMRFREKELRALADAFSKSGYTEFMPRMRQEHTFSLALPNFHYDTFDGDECYAKYVRILFPENKSAYIALSYIAPVFTVLDVLYPLDRGCLFHELERWAQQPEIAEIVALASSALPPLGMAYVAWNDMRLEEPVAKQLTLRDFLFQYDEYD